MPGFSIPTSFGCDDAGWGFPPEYSGPAAIVETGRTQRYLVTILNPLGTLREGVLQACYRCSRPGVTFDEVTIHHGQNEIIRPGKTVFTPVEFTFYEILNGAGTTNLTAEKIYAWWSNEVSSLKSSKLAPPLLAPDPGIYRDVTIEMFDGQGGTIWKYVLYEAWPVSVSPSALSYAENAISEITVKLRYNTYREIGTSNSLIPPRA